MKKIFAFVLAAASAYALSFAADMLVGGILNLYPSGVFKAVPTWTIIAGITGFIALGITRSRTPILIPFALITAFATFGGVVGGYYNFIVAGIMLLATLLVVAVTRRPNPAAPYDPWADKEKHESPKIQELPTISTEPKHPITKEQLSRIVAEVKACQKAEYDHQFERVSAEQREKLKELERAKPASEGKQ